MCILCFKITYQLAQFDVLLYNILQKRWVYNVVARGLTVKGSKDVDFTFFIEGSHC